MTTRKTWKCKGFRGYKNDNPKKFKFVAGGQTLICNLEELCAHDKWVAEQERKMNAWLRRNLF